MRKHALIAHELVEYFGSSLGARAQTYDACGLNQSPDPEAGITDQFIRDAKRHRRVRALLATLDPGHYAVLALAYSVARPLPVPVLRDWGGEEATARVALTLDRGSSRPKAGVLDQARALLAQALDAYALARRPLREAA